jgi:hypothetical protein
MSLLAGDVAKGDFLLSAPNSRIVMVQMGTDDFCDGTSVADFSNNITKAMKTIASFYSSSKIVAAPLLNLDSMATQYSSTHMVSGFAGTTPSCRDMRTLFASCKALSAATRPISDLNAMTAALESAVNEVNNQNPHRAIFANWNVEKPEATIDCTHPSSKTLQEMGERGWAQAKEFLLK